MHHKWYKFALASKNTVSIKAEALLPFDLWFWIILITKESFSIQMKIASDINLYYRMQNNSMDRICWDCCTSGKFTPGVKSHWSHTVNKSMSHPSNKFNAQWLVYHLYRWSCTAHPLIGLYAHVVIAHHVKLVHQIVSVPTELQILRLHWLHCQLKFVQRIVKIAEIAIFLTISLIINDSSLLSHIY